ncbi:MAG: 30S ribosomal protein S6 [Clostridiales bacterium]|nr:30S ribosomal protein S6 [Clostridiales bacterium]
MNSYELLYIIKPTVEEEARAALIARFADIVKNDNGEVENIDEWGMRKLAYAIDYISEGYYVLMNFKANPDLPAELERNLKISEDVMRFMVVKKEQE